LLTVASRAVQAALLALFRLLLTLSAFALSAATTFTVRRVLLFGLCFWRLAVVAVWRILLVLPVWLLA